MTPRQRAIKEAEVREREIRAKEVKEKEAMECEAAEARAELAKARAEMEKAKADAIESVSNEFFNNTESLEERENARSEHRTVGPSLDPVIPMNKPQPSAGIKIHNDVNYVRQERDPFAGKLVGEKREFLTIDGENYVECRILMRMEFKDISLREYLFRKPFKLYNLTASGRFFCMYKFIVEKAHSDGTLFATQVSRIPAKEVSSGQMVS
jgi:hypothetical protein